MTKTELKQYTRILEEIAQLEEEIETVMARAKFPSAKEITDMPLAPHSNDDKIGEAIARADELEDLLLDKKIELMETQIKIEKAIAKLSVEERILCRYRYINGMKWEEICLEMSSSWNRTHGIHRRALEKLSQE